MTLVDNHKNSFARLKVVEPVAVIGELHAVVLEVGMEAHLIVELVFLKSGLGTLKVLCPVVL